MIETFVQRFEAGGRDRLLQQFRSAHPDGYEAIVKAVVEQIGGENDYDDSPDPERIHRIDDGDYQGTLLFVIGARGYQPSTYWAVKVGYGSCSGCDTYQAVREYNNDPPTEEQAKEYLTMAIHVLQGLTLIGGDRS